MIDSIYIENFRRIVKAYIPLRDGITVLSGNNGREQRRREVDDNRGAPVQPVRQAEGRNVEGQHPTLQQG